jgi:hypothetical protein
MRETSSPIRSCLKLVRGRVGSRRAGKEGVSWRLPYIKRVNRFKHFLKSPQGPGCFSKSAWIVRLRSQAITPGNG